jgi:hypothetical protein
MRGSLIKRGKSSKAKTLGGRSGRKPKPGERVHLGFRISPRLKRRLKRAAKESTRSLSQEVEFRLEESLYRVPLDKVLKLAQALFKQALDITTDRQPKSGGRNLPRHHNMARSFWTKISLTLGQETSRGPRRLRRTPRRRNER